MDHLSSEQRAQLGRQEQELREVQAARQRMRTGSYGLCDTCGEPIGLGRLRARPEARFCLQHEEQWEKEHP
jgi:DnaK suppressor protein